MSELWSQEYLQHPRPVRISRHFISQILEERLDEVSLVKLVWKQALAERRFAHRRRHGFRYRENQRAVQAYRAMDLGEFEWINARQRWANWKTIPRNLDGVLTDRPVQAIDLCCGVGHSTEVLACYLPRGSSILGLEYVPEFANLARRRTYLGLYGELVPTRFRVQSILETFHEADGTRVADRSIDLVNSCGAIGFHFDAAATGRIAREIDRVLKQGGLALIDSGKLGTTRRQLISIFSDFGFTPLRSSKSCLIDRTSQVCFRKG